jgi:aspartate-semialdehyde dehydrogenase
MSPQSSRPSRTLPSTPSVAVAGATGAVGHEIISTLEKRNFPLSSLKLLASARSAGQRLTFKGTEIAVEVLDETSLEGVDIAFFSAGSSTSKSFARRGHQGPVVIDNSSAFRMDDDVPLVVTEVNPAEAFRHNGIIANPNCVAIIAAVALWPLHRQNRIRRIIAATYQSASGAGAAAMAELKDATGAWLAGQPHVPRVLPHPYAFNVFSHNTAVDPVTGDNDEETKVVRELRKIMGEPSLRVGVTCIRVPVLRAHTMALTVEFENRMTPGDVSAVLACAPGLRIVDDRAGNLFPMPIHATGQDDVLAGRFRADQSDPDGHTVSFMLCGDQLLKGAALNAVQIAEVLLRR